MPLTAAQLVRLSIRGRLAGAGPENCVAEETGAPVDEHLAEHVPRVYRFALSLTGDVHRAEDITQDTFVRAWKRRRRLRRGDEATRVWLFRTAHNLWRDHLRKASRNDRSIHDASFDAASEQNVPAIDQQEAASQVLSAMARLPDRQREVLHLAACEQLSIDAISAVLGISRDAVKASLSLARQRVRSMLDSQA